MNRMNRRTFAWSSFLTLGCLGTRAIAKGLTQGRLLLVFPAKQMQKRTQAFVDNLQDSYVKTGTPYPIYSVLFESELLPDTLVSMQAMGHCGNLLTKDNAFTFSKRPVADLTLPYHAILDNQTLRIEIILPKNLTIHYTAATAGQPTSFVFEPAIAVHQVDRLKMNSVVAPIPERLMLSAIRSSASSLRYELSTPDESAAYGVVLDFTADSGSPKISYEAKLAPMRRSIRGVGLSLVFALMWTGLIGCQNHNDGGPPQAIQDIEQCFDQPAPDGYVRINSKAAGLAGCPSSDPNTLNVFVYTNYSSKSSGTKLLVCSDAPIPGGWIDVSGSYHAEKGCDSARYHGSSYDNVRLIYTHDSRHLWLGGGSSSKPIERVAVYVIADRDY